MSNIIYEILKNNLNKFLKHEYIYEKIDGEYKSYSYESFYRAVNKTALFLNSKGLRGKKIAIYSKNSYKYMVADIAIMAYTGIVVELSEQWNERDIEKIIEEIGLDAIIYENDNEGTIDLLEINKKDVVYIPFDEINEFQVDSEAIPIEVDEQTCSKIVFSSGTTGIPKAVMLTQNNMFANIDNLLRRAAMNKDDICYLFLPLSHTYGGICNFLYSVVTGMKIYLCSDKNLIMKELQEVKPTVFCAVPILYEKIYQYGIEFSVPVPDILGGRIKHLFSGGAYLQSDIRKSFKNQGLNLLEAYGLSETSSLVSLEYPNEDDYASVGDIFENIDVKISEADKDGIGEITVKGENIFIGYFNQEDMYKNCFDDEGYFKTGDLGYKDGNKLYLVGRKKRVIIRSNARNIYPDEIEKIISDNFDVDSVKVYEKDYEINCILYSNTLNDINLEQINKYMPKHSKIDNIKVMKNNLDTKLK